MIVYGCLYPWRFERTPESFEPLMILSESWNFPITLWTIRDLFINVAMYLPFGAFGYFSAQKHGRWKATAMITLLAMLLSMAVELAQLYTPSRTASAIDIAANTFGALAGTLFAGLLPALPSPVRRIRKRDRAAMLVLVAWAVYLLYPFFPVLGRTELYRKLDAIGQAPVLALLPFVYGAAAWYVSGQLFQALELRNVRGWLPFTVLFVPLQILISTRQPGWPLLMGAIAGVLVFAVLGERRWLGVSAMLTALILRDIWPPSFGPAQPFTWIPFGGALQLEWQSGALILIEKGFLYSAAIWTLIRAGLPLWIGTWAVVILLFVLEGIQIYEPSHTPEITDPLIALLLGFAFTTVRVRQIPSASLKP